MIIGQITDLHIGFDGEDAVCKNTIRLNGVLDAISDLRAKPDVLLITGDLIEGGNFWAYKSLKKSLEALDIPYFLTLGNHDNREAFIQTFSDTHFCEGFLQYTIEEWPLRIIVLDTLGVGLHGGEFCETRAAWLKARLEEQPKRPTVIALHHPPIQTGIQWMTASESDPWVRRLHNTISPHENVIRLISGHVHRSIFSYFAGRPLSVALAVAPQVKLELADIDPDLPDGRVLLTDGVAGYCLHQWDGTNLTTHNGIHPEGKPIIAYDEAHAFVVRHTMDLPPKDS